MQLARRGKGILVALGAEALQERDEDGSIGFRHCRRTLLWLRRRGFGGLAPWSVFLPTRGAFVKSRIAGEAAIRGLGLRGLPSRRQAGRRG
jgi:hypothetical protein